jgi:hypothetical protein
VSTSIAFLNDEGQSGVPIGAHNELLTEIEGWEETRSAFYFDKTMAWEEYQELFSNASRSCSTSTRPSSLPRSASS